jgi:hypothetical protein
MASQVTVITAFITKIKHITNEGPSVFHPARAKSCVIFNNSGSLTAAKF